MDQAKATLRTARIIAAALPIGVVILWIVGWVLTKGGSTGVAPAALRGDVATWIWAGAAAAGFIGALRFRGRALQAADAHPGEPPSPAGLGQTQANLIVAWALLEGPALVGGVFFLLLAIKAILWATATVYFVGVILTFPRPEWFGATADGPS